MVLQKNVTRSHTVCVIIICHNSHFRSFVGLEVAAMKFRGEPPFLCTFRCPDAGDDLWSFDDAVLHFLCHQCIVTTYIILHSFHLQVGVEEDEDDYWLGDLTDEDVARVDSGGQMEVEQS